MDGDYDDPRRDNALGPSESLDSDGVPAATAAGWRSWPTSQPKTPETTKVDYRKRLGHLPGRTPKTRSRYALITNWHKAITSRDIDALVQLKLLTKAL